jgi:hypothetical protein
MKKDKCDKCCIGFGNESYDGGELVDEGYDGYLDEEFTFCPHCGNELPEYVRPERKPRDYSKPGPFDEVLRKFYQPAIEEQLKSIMEPSILKTLIDNPRKQGILVNLEAPAKVTVHDPMREQREHNITWDDYEPIIRHFKD